MAKMADALAIYTTQAQQSSFFSDKLKIYNVLSYAGSSTINDGVTDATSAIQAAIDAANSDGGGTVYFPSGTYLVSPAATTKTIVNNTTSVVQYYCIEVKSNVTLDLGDSTIKLKSGSNATVFVNKSLLYSDTADSNIIIKNGTIDVNNSQQTSAVTGTIDGILMANLTYLGLYNIRFDNCVESGVTLYGVRYFNLDQLHVSQSNGDGFRIGTWASGASYDQRCIDGQIGRLEANNCYYNVAGVNQYGDPFKASLKNVTVDSIRARACGGAYKITKGSESVTIGSLIYNGATAKNAYNASLTSGIKIIGDGTGTGAPVRITISNLISTDCLSKGLEIDDVTDVCIGSYTGHTNGSGDTGYPDVSLVKIDRLQIGNIISQSAGTAGVYLYSTVNDCQIGNIYILNCGAVTADAGVYNSAAKCTINSIIARDTRTPKKMAYAYQVASATAIANVDNITVDGFLTQPIRTNSPSSIIKNPIFSTSVKNYAVITLTAGTSSTVANTNGRYFDYTSFFNVPIIEFIPVNSAARSLMTVPFRYATSTTGFVITHPTAAGTEKFIYRIKEYVYSTDNIV